MHIKLTFDVIMKTKTTGWIFDWTKWVQYQDKGCTVKCWL